MSPRAITWSVILLFSVLCLIGMWWVMNHHAHWVYGFLIAIVIAFLLIKASNRLIGREPISARERESILKEHELNIYELAVQLDAETDEENKRVMITEIISECNLVLDALKMKAE